MFETGETITNGETCCKDVGQTSSSKGFRVGPGELAKTIHIDIESLVHRIEALERQVKHLRDYLNLDYITVSTKTDEDFDHMHAWK